MKQLIVLGNGFDLACGLKSSYNDFFLDRFNKLFGDSNFKPTNIDDENFQNKLYKKRVVIWLDTNHLSNPRIPPKPTLGYKITRPDYFEEFSKNWTNDKQTLTRWDVIFLFAELCLDKKVSAYKWQDIESIILEVISIALDFQNKYSLKLNYASTVSIGRSSIPGEQLFKELIYNISFTGELSIEKTAAELLNELEKFESAFANFITQQYELEPSSNYISQAKDLLERLSRCYGIYLTQDAPSEVDVLSFNYSLDKRFLDILNDTRIESWSNIHGIASFDDPNVRNNSQGNGEHVGDGLIPAPIFGVDNHNVDDNDDWRIIFTKPYRVIENGVNEIRKSNGYANTDKITIYGHSLGQADYSYFETIFDENNLYNSNTEIEYFYYAGKDPLEKIKNRQNAIKTLYNLLTDYGKTLSDRHGNNIINKLNIENRLTIVSTENLPS